MLWDDNMSPLRSYHHYRHVLLDPVAPMALNLHLFFFLCRLSAECLLLANVPSEDSEWSRDGSCPDFSQGIFLYCLQGRSSGTSPLLQSTKITAGVSREICRRQRRRALPGFAAVLFSRTDVLVFHWGCRCYAKSGMQYVKVSTSL